MRRARRGALAPLVAATTLAVAPVVCSLSSLVPWAAAEQLAGSWRAGLATVARGAALRGAALPRVALPHDAADGAALLARVVALVAVGAAVVGALARGRSRHGRRAPEPSDEEIDDFRRRMHRIWLDQRPQRSTAGVRSVGEHAVSEGKALELARRIESLAGADYDTVEVRVNSLGQGEQLGRGRHLLICVWTEATEATRRLRAIGEEAVLDEVHIVCGTPPDVTWVVHAEGSLRWHALVLGPEALEPSAAWKHSTKAMRRRVTLPKVTKSVTASLLSLRPVDDRVDAQLGAGAELSVQQRLLADAGTSQLFADLSHAAPNARSTHEARAFAAGDARVDVSGAVHIAPELDHPEYAADARQVLRAVALTPEASATARPTLMLRTAEEVDASHGAALSRGPGDTLPLQARGLSRGAAAAALVRGAMQLGHWSDSLAQQRAAHVCQTIE